MDQKQHSWIPTLNSRFTVRKLGIINGQQTYSAPVHQQLWRDRNNPQLAEWRATPIVIVGDDNQVIGTLSV